MSEVNLSQFDGQLPDDAIGQPWHDGEEWLCIVCNPENRHPFLMRLSCGHWEMAGWTAQLWEVPEPLLKMNAQMSALRERVAELEEALKCLLLKGDNIVFDTEKSEKNGCDAVAFIHALNGAANLIYGSGFDHA